MLFTFHAKQFSNVFEYLQVVSTSFKHVFKICWKCFGNVFKTFVFDILKRFGKQIQNVLGRFWHMHFLRYLLRGDITYVSAYERTYIRIISYNKRFDFTWQNMINQFATNILIWNKLKTVKKLIINQYWMQQMFKYFKWILLHLWWKTDIIWSHCTKHFFLLYRTE